MAEKMNLAQKLIEVRKSIPLLEKEKENKEQGYKYVSDSQVAHAIKEKMDELGIIIWPSCRKMAVIPTRKEKSTQLLTELAMTFVIEDAETGETRTCKWYSHGADSADKGPAKAATLGQKRWILKLFNVPTDKDDPDGDPADGNGKPAARPPAQRKAAPAAGKRAEDLIGVGSQRILITKLANAGINEDELMAQRGYAIAAVPKKEYNGIVSWLDNKIAQRTKTGGTPSTEESDDDPFSF